MGSESVTNDSSRLLSIPVGGQCLSVTCNLLILWAENFKLRHYLWVSQLNDTLTNCADHCEPCSHDTINRYVRGEQITPRLVWENGRGQVVQTPCGDVLFEDTVLDKNDSFAIELVRHQ